MTTWTPFIVALAHRLTCALRGHRDRPIVFEGRDGYMRTECWRCGRQSPGVPIRHGNVLKFIPPDSITGRASWQLHQRGLWGAYRSESEGPDAA